MCRHPLVHDAALRAAGSLNDRVGSVLFPGSAWSECKDSETGAQIVLIPEQLREAGSR